MKESDNFFYGWRIVLAERVVSGSAIALSIIAAVTGVFMPVWIICAILIVMLLGFYVYGLRGSHVHGTNANTDSFSSSSEMPAQIAVAADLKF